MNIANRYRPPRHVITSARFGSISATTLRGSCSPNYSPVSGKQAFVEPFRRHCNLIRPQQQARIAARFRIADDYSTKEMPMPNRRVTALMVSLAVVWATALPSAAQQNAAFAKVDDDPSLPRVLLIGDSISIGYTVPVREALGGKANVHRAPTNCGPTSNGIKQIDNWLGEGKWDVIHFNFGLHDLKLIDGKHQVPIDDYAKNLQTIAEKMQATGAKVIWCTTTPVPKGKLNPPRNFGDVDSYNAVAAKVMDELKIPTNDLCAFARERIGDIQKPNDVHFTAAGSKILGEEVARQIAAQLGSPPSE
jgi:acyl-CoA thioesterase-1